MTVGGSMRCDEYGAFGLAWKSALDLRRSYQRAERYGRVLTSVSTYELRLDDDSALMLLHRAGDRRLGLRLSNEQTIAATVQISREVSGVAFTPLAVFFKHPPPPDVAAHASFFGCRIEFDADHDGIRVSRAQLDTPNKLGDIGFSEFFDERLDQELAELTEEASFKHAVARQISQSLSDGAPSVASVAERLGVSGRTLQRRLAEQDCAFQDLVDAERRRLAEQLLRKTDYALAEVAFLTGFSEQSAFNRAFKRWNGRTPSHFRRDATA